MLPYVPCSGPPEDMEMFKRQRGQLDVPLPIPGGLPVGQIAFPLPDPLQKHVSDSDVAQAINPQQPNPLFFGHFVGTNMQQAHVPGYLSTNESLNWE